MKFIFTEPFKKDYGRLSFEVQRALNKALKFLSINLNHPSLNIRKLPSTSIWYGRATLDYRFTFQFEDDTIVLRRVGTHDILDKERRV